MFVVLFLGFVANVSEATATKTAQKEIVVGQCACQELCKDPQQCICDVATREGTCGDPESGDVITKGYREGGKE